MYRIIRKEQLSTVITLFEVEAPLLARAAKPGQFLIVRALEDSERIPLTVCDFNPEKGSVTIVIQTIGASSKELCALEQGDYVCDVVGPLGRPSDFMEQPVEEVRGKSFVFLAGGLGTAPVYPQAKYLHSIGAKVDVILGAKTESLVILEKEMAGVCDNLYICTDDGSKGFKGLVTGKLEELIGSGRHYDTAVAIGPMIMMKFATLSARKFNLPIIVSMNTLMVDGTGMCGACRLTVDGQTKFACVDGPEFDGYKVDFDGAMRRLGIYRSKEMEANEAYEQARAARDHKCRIGIGK